MKNDIRKRLQELANIKPTSEAIEGCAGGSCELEIFHEGKKVWGASVGCTPGCQCEGMPLDCGKGGSKTIPLTDSMKRTLRKKGYKKDFDNIKVKGTVKKKAKLKEATTGCKGTCVLKVNGETVATVGCDSGPRGSECGGIQGAGCGGSGQTVINLTPDLKKFKR